MISKNFYIKTCENVCFDDMNKNLPYAMCKMPICNALFLLKKHYLILKKKNSFFSLLFFMQSFNFCQLLVQIFYLFQYIIQKKAFLKEATIISSWTADLSLQLYLKKRLCHRCFPADFAKFLRTTFLQNTTAPQLLYGPCIIFTT